MAPKGKGTQTGTDRLGDFLLPEVARANSLWDLTNSFGPPKLSQLGFLIPAPKTGMER